jgi:hypothetical protein
VYLPVEAGDAAVRVEGLECRHGARTVPVLVVDGGAHPHQTADVDAHGGRAREASLAGALEGLGEDGLRVDLLLLGGTRHGSVGAHLGVGERGKREVKHTHESHESQRCSDKLPKLLYDVCVEFDFGTVESTRRCFATIPAQQEIGVTPCKTMLS